MKLKSFYFKFFIFLNLLVFIVFSVFPPFVEVFKVLADEAPKLEIKSYLADILPGNDLPVTLEIKNISNIRLVSVGAEFNLGAGYSFDDSSIPEECEECVRPEILGNNILFRNIADLLPNETKRISFEIKTPNTFEIGTQHNINFTAFGFAEDDLINKFIAATIGTFKILPFEVEVNIPTDGLVGDQVTNQVTITNNNIQDSSTLQIPVTTTPEITPSITPTPDDESGSEPAPTVTPTPTEFEYVVEPATLEINLDEGLEYVPGSQRVENYDPARVIFNAFNESVSSARTILQWVFQDGIKVENFTNPIKVFFDTIFRNIGHNQTADNRVNFTARYNDTPSTSIEYNKQININTTIGYFDLSKQCSPYKVSVGENVTCKIKVKTSIEYSVSNVKIEDQIPDGLEFVSYSPIGGLSILSSQPDKIEWLISSIPNGSIFEFEYVLKLNQFYSDLSSVLTADNFKSVTTLEANWQNILDSTVGNNTDSTETKITTDRIDYTFGIRKKGSSVDYTKSVLSSIGDVFETRNVLDFPNTPTKNFELKIFAPVGTKISNFSLNPSMCVDGCTEIILPTNNISPNSQIEFSFDIEVLNDTRLNYTSIIRNLYRGSYYNSFDQKKDLVDELTIEIIEPKIEIQKTKISGIVAKGEIFSTKTTFKNSGKDVAYVLNVQDFVDPSKVTLNSTTPITVVSSLGSTFSFSFDGDKLISENLILLPSESIELIYELKVKDYVLYGDDIFLNSYVSDYSNRESSYDGIKRNYSEFTHEYKLKAKEPLVSTNITVSPFSISEIGGKFLIARNETFDLNLFVREVGGGKVYNGNLEFYVNGDKFIYTDFDSAKSWFRSRGLDLLGIDNHQVFTESFELNPYYIKSAKFTLKPLRSLSIGDEINLEILFEGQDAISQQVRKDGSDRTIQDVDNDDKTNKAISIVRKDFTPPVGLVKFFVDGIETGFTNSDFVDVSLEVVDPNLKHTIEVLSSSLPSEIKRVSINEDSVLKIELVNGSVFEYTIATIPFENEYLKIIELSEPSLKLLLKNLPSDREHVFRLVDWEDNSTNVSKQIVVDKVPPILAWIELSPSDVYRNIEYTATKNIFAHLGLVDDNPGGFYRISLDGVNYSDWASLSIGNNVVSVDLSSQGSPLKLYAQFKDLAGNLYPLVLFDTINYTNHSLTFDFSFVNNRVNTSFPDISFNIHNPADSSNITEKVYLSKGDSSTSLGGFVFYEYLPNKTNIDTTSTGTKTLCFKAKAITLQESNVVCKNVIFDNVAPSGSINYTSGQINFNAIDPVLSDGTVGSNVLARVRFNGGSWSDWVSSSSPFYTGNVSWNFGINYIHYQFKDTANNISSIQEYIYDYHPDSNPRITINDNEPFTDLEKVRVKLDPQRNALGQLPSLFRIKQKYYPIDPRNPTLSQVETNFTHWVEFSTQFEWRLTNAFFETMSNGVKPEYSFGQYTLGVEYMYPDTTLSGSVDWDSIYYAPVYGAHIVLDRALHLTSITGQTHNYNITITNFGSLPWQKAIEGVVNPVRLVYRWKHKLPDYQYPWGTIRDFLPLHYRGGEFDLPSNVYYGQVINIPVSIVSPEIYGLYDIEIDLVHEGKGYFADFGSSSVKGNVDVHQDPDRPPLSKGINPETGQPFDFDLPEGIGGYYAGQIIYIRGIWERAPAGVWWHYQVWDSGILYKFVNIWQGDSYLGHRAEVVVRATGVGWNFEVLSIRKIIPTFSAQVHHRGQPSRIVVNRGTTDTLYYLFLNTGSSDAVWRRHSTALRVLSSTPGINLNFQTLIQQDAVNPGSVASVIYPFNISSNSQFGDHLVCFSFLTTYDNVDRQMLQECITFEVQPTLAEQREIICSVPQKVYSQPSTNASVLGTLNKDDKFIHTRTFGSFLEIYYGSSSTQKGYLENTWNCFSAAVSVPNPIKITELPPRPVRPTGNQGYIIRLNGVGILHGPSNLFPEVCSIPFDGKVTIIGEVDFDSYSVGWLKVRGENGCEGWVSKGHVDYTGPQTKLQVNLAPEYSTAYSCNGGHNVHIGPAYEFRVVGFLNRNQNVFIREEWNGWVNIGNGWIPKFVMCRGRYTPSSTFTGAVGGASVFMDTYYERPIKDSYRIPFLGGFSAVRLNKYLQVVPHGGVDYAAPCGTKVYASSSGKVVNVRKGSTIGGNNPIYTDYANFVTIDHSNNTRTRYFHLGDVYVNLGDYVQTGQLIGTIGLTGYTTGCHLHFELWADKNNPNSKVDPEEIFNLSLSGLAPNLSILQRQSRLSNYSIVSGDLGKIHPVCGTYVRDYNFVMNSLGDINTQYANIMYNPNNGQSYVLRGDIRLAYWNKNGCDLLKYPTSEELTAAVSPQGTSGRYQNFDRGQIYLSSKGTYLVFGKIWDLYNLIDGTRSKYGFPTSDVFIQNSVKCQRFEGGVLCENFAKEFFAIYSVSGNRVPISGIHDFCGGKRQDYTDGSHIIYNPNTQKAYLLKGGIAWSYWTNGGCAAFGLPTGNSGRIDNKHGKGWYQHFEKANIYWHETNRKVQPGIVRGNIRNYFESKGGVSNGNSMGWPEGNEWGSTSYTCNSNGISGTMQHFTNGKVYLSKIATVFVPWSDWNWINHYENVEGFNNLGWPRTEKIRENNKERMYFEKGYLEYRNVILGSPITFVDLNCSFVNLSVLEEVRQHLKTAGYENLEDSPAKFTKAIELLIQDFRHLIDNPQDIPGVIVNMVVGVVEGFVDNMITDFLSLIGMTFQMAVDFINNPDVSSKLQNILDSIRSVDILSLAISFLGGNLDEYISTDIYGRSRLVGRMILNILMLVFPVGIVVKALSVTDDLARMMVRVIDTLSNSTKLVKVNNLNKLLTKFKGIIGNSDDLWKVYNNAVYYVNKGIDIYPDVDYVWLSRISGDASKLTKSHLNAAKLISSRGIRVNADELPSILANVSGDISRLNSQALEELINLAKTLTINVDEYARISAVTRGNNLAKITADQYQALKRELGDLTQRTDISLYYGIKGVQNSVNWKFVDGDVRALIHNVSDHVKLGDLKIDPKSPTGYSVSGMHTRLAEQLRPSGTVRITPVTPKNAQGVYEALVEIKDPNRVWAQKLTNGGKSTFFPDEWSWQRITEEVEHAVRYNEGLFNATRPELGYKGKSIDGSIEIRFYYDDTTEYISSYFPVL